MGRTLQGLALLLALAGCPEAEKDVTTTSPSVDLDADADADTDSDTDADADTDADSDPDSGLRDDTCCHSGPYKGGAVSARGERGWRLVLPEWDVVPGDEEPADDAEPVPHEVDLDPDGQLR